MTPPSSRPSCSFLAAPAARAALVALLATAAGNALSLPDARRLGRYDFAYELQGDAAARPVQVFSDGAGTVYLQFAPGAPAPAIFAGRAPLLLVPQSRGPFQVVHTRAREFVLALGGARARVVHAGGLSSPAVDTGTSSERAPGSDAPDGAPQTPGATKGESADAAPGAALPADGGADIARAIHEGHQLASLGAGAPPAMLRWTEPERRHDAPVVFDAGSAVLTREARASLDALVARLGAGSVVTLEGRGDASRSDGLAMARVESVRAALIARGLDAGRLRELAADRLSEPLAPGASASGTDRRVAVMLRWTTPAVERQLDPSGDAAAALVWEVRRSDGDIEGALRRWGAQAGWQVDWSTGIRAPITGEARLDAGSFVEAVARVVAGLQAQGYPLRARTVGEHTVRFEAMR